MRMQVNFGLASILLLAVPCFAAPQRGGGMGGFRGTPSVVYTAAGSAAASRASIAPARMIRGARSTVVRSVTAPRAAAGTAASFGANGSGVSSSGVNPNGTIEIGGNSLSVQQALHPFPDYGFDFEHLTAIHRDDNIKALIDPATQVQIANAQRRHRRSPRSGGGFVFLAGGGAYVLPDESFAADVNADQDSEASDQTPRATRDEAQDAAQGEAQDAARERVQRSNEDLQSSAEEAAGDSSDAELALEQSENLPDEGEFTLILRSGQEIEAVAFTRANDQIIYISTTGGRHTLALSEIDSDATVRMNQERGTPLQLPL